MGYLYSKGASTSCTCSTGIVRLCNKHAHVIIMFRSRDDPDSIKMSGSKSAGLFIVCLYLYCLLRSNYKEDRACISLTSLIPPHICVCPKPGIYFWHHIPFFFMLNDLRLAAIVRFVDIDRIIDHHCSNYLSIKLYWISFFFFWSWFSSINYKLQYSFHAPNAWSIEYKVIIVPIIPLGCTSPMIYFSDMSVTG